MNTSDTEQFPVLGVSSKQHSSNPNQNPNPNKVLNFKHIIMKQSTVVSAAAAGTIPLPASEEPPVVAAPGPVVAQASTRAISSTIRNLSRGNIFLGAFYKIDDDGGGRDDDDGYERTSDTYRSTIPVPITSILVDSCDTSYDKLYH